MPNPVPATPGGAFEDPRGKCGLKTQFAADNACILPPAASEGFQLHVGPTDYNDPNDTNRFLLQPGQETSECWVLQMPNTEDVYYQSWVMSGRDGTHHVIGNYAAPGAGKVGGFVRPCPAPAGTLPSTPKPFMKREPVAPEYADVGFKIPANAMGTYDMHYYNHTDKPILREMWINYYTAPTSQIKRKADQLRGFGGVTWRGAGAIPAGADKVYTYSAPVKGNGNILMLLGHYHAHGVEFTATITPKGTTTPEQVFQMYDYGDPAVFWYNSVAKNPQFSAGAPGATSGVREIHDGDVITWSCHIVNDLNVPLEFTNEVDTGEMCNLWGWTVGITPWSANQ